MRFLFTTLASRDYDSTMLVNLLVFAFTAHAAPCTKADFKPFVGIYTTDNAACEGSGDIDYSVGANCHGMNDIERWDVKLIGINLTLTPQSKKRLVQWFRTPTLARLSLKDPHVTCEKGIVSWQDGDSSIKFKLKDKNTFDYDQVTTTTGPNEKPGKVHIDARFDRKKK